MQRAISLAEDDCRNLSELMQKGFSFHDALELIRTSRNQKCIEWIEAQALTGRKLNAILIQTMPAALKGYVEGFSSCMTLAESIAAAIEIHKGEQDLKQKLIRELLYPLLLMAGVLAGIFLFSNTILPAMIRMMAGFHHEIGDLLRIQKIIRIFVIILLLACLALILSGAYFLSPGKISRTLVHLSSFSTSTLLHQYASILFTRYFLACNKRHVSTMQALQTIAALKNTPLASGVAQMLDDQLMHGKRMQNAVEQACLEEKLVSFFRVAIQAGECTSMLEGYLNMAEKRAQRQVRIFSKTVQLICYSCIAVILILIYRILMMPMQLLKTF